MKKQLGIYFHIPFCASRCTYCDFCSIPRGEKVMPLFQDAICKHVEESAEQLTPFVIDTVYFGGGTPSYYGAQNICDIFNVLKTSGNVLKSSEVTVECNPESVRKRELALLRKEGVNRLSIGMKSANSDLLKIIGRRHSFKHVQTAVAAARSEGFDNVSLDLIYGLPSQTRKDWADTLNRALELNPEHISCYGLKLGKRTKMYQDYYDSPLLPSDDEQADMYLFTVDTLEQYGYPQYEISNFSLKGYESQHNLKYWKLDDYMSFGPSAHSYVDGTRYSFISNVRSYVDGIQNGGRILDEYEQISYTEQASEYIMLGLRLKSGISRKEYTEQYRGDFDLIERFLKEFEKKGWAYYKDERWGFTSSGFLLSNTLINILLEAQTQAKIGATPWLQHKKTVISRDEITLPSGKSKIFLSDFS